MLVLTIFNFAFISVLSIFFYNLIINKNLFVSIHHEGPQRIHEKPTSRSGGLIIFLGYLMFTFFESIILNDYTLFKFILPFSFIFIISVYEDLYKSTNPKIRLLLMIFSTMLFLFINNIYIEFSIPFIKSLLNLKLVQIIFLVLFITTIINGYNIFDGSNGHCSFVGIINMIVSLLIAIKYDQFELIYFVLPLILLLFIFLIFNYPRGLIFLGDTGAYFIGWSSCVLLIYIFTYNSTVSNFISVNILFYPIFETIFSFFRKIISKKSPLKPDSYHLHLLMVQLLKKKNIKYYNSLNTLYLSPIWLFPSIFILFIPNDIRYSIILLILQVVNYLAFYFFIKRKLL